MVLEIYSDPDRKVLVDTLSLSVSASAKRNLIFGSRELASDTDAQTGYIKNVQIVYPAQTISTSWLEGFSNRHKMTIPASVTASTLENFPVAIHLGTSVGTSSSDLNAIFSALTDSERKKIAVTIGDGVTQCPVEIERWTSAGSLALLHAKIPFIYSGQDTELYLYYGGSLESNDFWVGDVTDPLAQEVWDNAFVFVCHMNQDPAAGNDVYDSVSAYAGSSLGTMTSGDLIDGLGSGLAIDFDGSDDAIGFGDLDAIDATLAGASAQTTIESILFPIGAMGSYGICGKYDSGTNQRGMMYRIVSSNIQFHYEDAALSDRRSVGGSTTFAASDWHYAAAHYDATQGTGNDGLDRVDLWVGGGTDLIDETEALDDSSGSVANIESTTATFGLGAIINGGAAANAFQGYIGELRVSNILRPTEWLTATNNFLFDNVISFDVVEQQSEVWYSNYAYRRKFTIDADLIDTTLTDFPVTLHIGSSVGLGADDLSSVTSALTDALANRIVVTDADGQVLYTEIERWTSGSTLALLHVKVPAVMAGTDTVLYMYYDASQIAGPKTGYTGSANAAGVWDDDFKAVYHFNHNPAVGAGTLKDATQYGNDGAMAGAMDGTDLVQSQGTGYALDFNGSNQRFVVPHASAISLIEPVTVTSVVLTDYNWNPGDQDYNTICWKDSLYNGAGYGLAIYERDADSSTRFNPPFGYKIIANGYNNGTWRQMTGKNATNGASLEIYLDGAWTATDGGVVSNMVANTRDLYIGGPNVQHSDDKYFNGTISELRISGVGRSDVWEAITYKSLFDTLGTWGPEETYTAPSWLGTYAYRRMFTVGASVVGATLTDFPVALHIGSAVGKLGGRAGRDLSGTITGAGGLADAEARQLAVTTSDGVTECFVEIERWTSGSTLGMLHFRAPTLSPTSDTKFFLYWDKAASDNAKVGPTGSTSAASVWDDDYLVVLHMAQDPSTGGTPVLESAGNYDFAASGSMTSGDLVDGLGSAKGLDFDGSDDGVYKTLGPNPVNDTECTLEAIFNIDTYNAGGFDAFVYNYDTSGFVSHALDLQAGVPRALCIVNASAYTAGSSVTAATGTYQYAANSWVSGGSVLLFVNEVKIPGAVATGSLTRGGTKWEVGESTQAGFASREMDGVLSEVRASQIKRSDSWLNATYYTLFDTFGYWAATEAYSDAGTGGTAATPSFTPGYVAISGQFKQITGVKVCVNGVWKDVTSMRIAINNVWKTIS